MLILCHIDALIEYPVIKIIKDIHDTRKIMIFYTIIIGFDFGILKKYNFVYFCIKMHNVTIIIKK